MKYQIHVKPLPLCLVMGLAMGLGLSVTAMAQDEGTDRVPDRIHGESHRHGELEEVVVTATPLSRNLLEMSQSATVLSGAALEREVANNIGDTLSRVPGLSNASFGQNVGRPVIRGFEGARVGVLNNNMASSDASAVSQDHAVSVEPFLADQIEVLKGPSTLLYGSGSIGGVVNIVTHTIPEEVPEEGIEGRAMIQGDSAADQRFAAARVDFGFSSLAFHANAFYRRTDDYEIPGAAELYPDRAEEGHEEGHEEEGHDEEAPTGVLENSFLDNEGGSLGAGWIGDRWRFGLSFTSYDSNYGIPGAHGHGHEEDEEHGDEQEEEEEEEHADEEEERVTIGLESERLDAELLGSQPFRGFEQLKLRFASTSYQHNEFEGAEVGTVFDNDTTDARLEMRHNPWGDWKGAFGAQYTDRDFGAIGEEAFVPPSNTSTAALFWVENAQFGEWQFDLGMRYENIDIEAQPPASAESQAQGLPQNRSFSPFSASAGAVWHLNEDSHLTFNLSHAERAPTDQELFAFGPHIATQTFEVGDSSLDKERNLHFETSYRLHRGALTGSVTLFYDDFSDYIYQRDTGQIEDELPRRQWSQQDADFYGAEIEVRYDFGHLPSGHWQAFVFADRVRAEFADGENVPRMPPSRIGLGLDWDHDSWAANLTWIHASSQTKIAEFETTTPAYDLLNAELSYLLPVADRFDWEVFAKAHNLLDEDIRNSTSFLKDQAPQIGRNYVLGLRARF